MVATVTARAATRVVIGLRRAGARVQARLVRAVIYRVAVYTCTQIKETCQMTS